jgi:hypothetical protein
MLAPKETPTIMQFLRAFNDQPKQIVYAFWIGAQPGNVLLCYLANADLRRNWNGCRGSARAA